MDGPIDTGDCDVWRAHFGQKAAGSGLGNALSIKGRRDEAIASYREAIRIDPKDADAYADLGNELLEKGLLDEALKSTEEALRLSPNNATAHQNIGAILVRKGRLDEGLASYKQAIRAYRQQGDQKEARAAYDEAIALLEKNQATTEVVGRFRDEAQELIEQKIERTSSKSTSDD